MRRTAFWQSSAARAALLYFALYAFVSLLSFAVLYFSATHDLRAQIREAVQQDVRALITIYSDQGHEALVRDIDLLSKSVEVKRSLYLLENADGSVIAGNVPTTPPFEDWKELTYKFSGNRSDHFFVYGTRLGDLWLFVGRRAHNVSEIQESILRSFLIGCGISIPLAFAGIIILTSRASKRVERIAGEMEAYIEGDLTRRVPIAGRHDEVDRLAGNINALLSRIEKLISSLKQVTTDVAHDLRTPLSRLRQRLEATGSAIQSTGNIPAGENTMEQAIEEVDAIIDTFDALLQIAELDASSRKARLTEMDLFDVAQFLAETYVSVAEDRGQSLSFTGESGAMIAGNRRLLAQLTANLLENALRHSLSGARIDLAVKSAPGSVELIVTDSGPGIPLHEREKVFERFYRLDASRSTPGSGLGLALVKAIADQHGATIGLADNNPGLIVTVSFRA